MWILIGCAAVSLGACLPLFLHYKPIKLSLAAAFKSLGTLCALIPALIAALRLDPLCWFFVAAIALHLAADYLLEFVFEIGAGIFMLGHICYTIAFLKSYPLTAAHPILFVCLMGFLLYMFYRHRSLIGKNMRPFIVYAAALCVMVSCGIAGGASVYGWSSAMIALGVALFFFSDCMVFRRMIFPNRNRHDTLIIATYYLAQLLLGGSCLFL